MALTEDLPVYQKMYQLLMILMDARNDFDKPYKYVVGDKMIDKALNCVSLIHYANEDRRTGARAEHLANFLMEFDILKTLIMVCRDRLQFKNSTVLGEVFIKTADVEDQASKWRASSVKALASSKKNSPD